MSKERKYGKWKNRKKQNDYSHAECSECGFIISNYLAVIIGLSSDDYVGVQYNFCPKCGAEMSV